MNSYIAVLTLLILLFTVFYQIKIWRVRSLLSPGFYFSVIWIFGVSGLLLFKYSDLLIETYPKSIDELNVLVAYTALCFIFVTKQGFKKVNKSFIDVSYLVSFRLYKVVSVFYSFLALYVFYTEGSGLDFSMARDNMHTTLENRSFWVGYFRLLSIPLSIYAGSKIIKSLLKIEKMSIVKSVFLILPFIADTLFSLTEGGRVAMTYGMMFYIVGAVLVVPLSFRVKEKKKIVLYGIFIVLLVNGMISWIANERKDFDNLQKELVKESLGPFKVLFGAMEYVNASYVGYQYRREDAVSNQLGYGQYTFNGFINWQIPFASRFGLENASLAKALGIYYHNQETYDYSREYYYVTHSAYIPIVKDFGLVGAFGAIFFIVYCSHYFFVRIQRSRNIRYSVNLFFYYLFLIYWAKSNFYGTLSESIVVPLYGFLIVDIINKVHKMEKSKNRILQ